MKPSRATFLVVLIMALGGGSASTAGCTNGTTPVCDDAGSCLILPPSPGGADSGSPEAASPESSTDGPVE
jgi:hypothetical protein